jgi:hypothetical protein
MTESVAPELPLPRDDAEPEEHWEPAPGYEGRYDVSSEGRVRSVRREGRHYGRTGVIMKPSRHNYGYFYFSLYDDSGRHRRVMVHQLVAKAFLGPRPEGLEACHDNGDPTCNAVWNLKWDTHSGNMLDKQRHGTDHQVNKERCPRDHPYDEENTYYLSGGGRACKTCARDSRKRYEDRKAKERGPREPEVLAKDQPCTRPGCDDLQLAKGLCGGHYHRQRRGQSLDDVRTCLHCGGEYEKIPGGEGRRKYCSEACMTDAHRQQVAARNRQKHARPD